jgi:hypothetical protein
MGRGYDPDVFNAYNLHSNPRNETSVELTTTHEANEDDVVLVDIQSLETGEPRVIETNAPVLVRSLGGLGLGLVSRKLLRDIVR